MRAAAVVAVATGEDAALVVPVPGLGLGLGCEGCDLCESTYALTRWERPLIFCLPASILSLCWSRKLFTLARTPPEELELCCSCGSAAASAGFVRSVGEALLEVNRCDNPLTFCLPASILSLCCSRKLLIFCFPASILSLCCSRKLLILCLPASILSLCWSRKLLTLDRTPPDDADAEAGSWVLRRGGGGGVGRGGRAAA